MDQTQIMMFLIAIGLIALVWYFMNPPKKEKCCSI